MILLILVLFSGAHSENIKIQKFTTLEECAYFLSDAEKRHDFFSGRCVDLDVE